VILSALAPITPALRTLCPRVLTPAQPVITVFPSKSRGDSINEHDSAVGPYQDDLKRERT